MEPLAPSWLLHLTPTDYKMALAMIAVWNAPNWGFKLVALAEAVRRFRRDEPQPDAQVARQ